MVDKVHSGLMMKAIGYWMTSLRDDKYYPPQAFIGALRPDVKARVVDYLNRGTVYRTYRGFSQCRFKCDRGTGLRGASDLTDGQWVWPKNLSHYVAEHDIFLPPEFIKQTKKAMPVSLEVEGLDNPEYEFWIKWCERNASREIKKEIAKARTNARSEYKRIRAEHFSNVARQRGVTGEECISRGCKNKTLVDLAFCVECASVMEPIDPGEVAYRNFDFLYKLS